MKKLFAAAVLVLLAGCVSVSKIESGDNTVGERLTVHLTGAWNHINAPNLGPAQVWTMEGLPVDQLLVYSGLKDGEAIHAPYRGPGPEKKSFEFRANMEPDQITALFEGMLSRDGSTYKLVKLEPMTFGGTKGFRFEYALTRKVDNVQLSGVGYGAVSRGELFALVYMAPRLAFFARHAPMVEAIAKTARIKI
ncbi:MAG TPA: hypothetical protein VHP37_19255 [Burkholderiales bacterium]|nr:hypothetical protein [Burkholderiales bacterium]